MIYRAMTSDQVFHPGLWYLLLASTAISLPLYIFILWKSKCWACAFLVLVVALSIYLPFYSAHNFGGAFGAGMAFACLSVFLAPISLIIWFLLRRPFRRRFEEDLSRQRFFKLGIVVIVLAQLFPILGSSGIDAACFYATRNNAKPLIEAARVYYRDYGEYPADINQLVPLVVADFPAPACSWLSGQDHREQTGFELTDCGNGVILLTNYSLDGTSIERYNFAMGNWSTLSFFDGACSYLR